MAQQTPRQVIHGIKALGRHFQKERARLSGSPILIIEGGGMDDGISSSSKGDNNNNNNMVVETMAGRHLHLLLTQQQLGSRIIVSKGGGKTTTTTNNHHHNSSSSWLFPTQNLVEQQLELLSRLGGSTVICGVGNRATLDLAKAVSDARRTWNTRHVIHDDDDDAKQLLLVANTYEAVLSCSHPYSLLLHEQEDILLAKSPTTTTTTTTVALLEFNMFENVSTSNDNVSTAIHACMAILLDFLWQQQQQQSNSNHNDNPSSYKNLEKAKQLLQDCWQMLLDCDNNKVVGSKENLFHNDLVDKIMETGSNYLEFGLESHPFYHAARSTPLAIAVSLIPTLFPNKDLLTVMASLTPALLKMMMMKQQQQQCKEETTQIMNSHYLLSSQQQQQRLPPPPPILLQTNESIKQLLTLIQNNQHSWNCFDVPQHELHSLMKLSSSYSLLPEEQSSL